MFMGKLVISLDFELHWGSIEKWNLNNMRSYFLDTRESIPKVLSIFKEYKIKATWATVGYLLAKDKAQLLSFIPNIKPTYKNDRLSSYNLIEQIGDNEKVDPFHYAGSLIERIINTSGQELASHTFSHYYCTEKGQTIEQFNLDLCAAQALVNKNYGINFKSLVFPRNQYNEEYLKVAQLNYFKVARSNPDVWFWNKIDGKLGGLTRAADTLVCISKPLSFNEDDIKVINGVTCVPSSRFFRPFKPSEKLIQNTKMNRIISEMNYAAKNNMNYHLWWHPHNFGNNVPENIIQLKQIIEHYRFLNEKYSFESVNMGQFV